MHTTRFHTDSGGHMYSSLYHCVLIARFSFKGESTGAHFRHKSCSGTLNWHRKLSICLGCYINRYISVLYKINKQVFSEQSNDRGFIFQKSHKMYNVYLYIHMPHVALENFWGYFFVIHRHRGNKACRMTPTTELTQISSLWPTILGRALWGWD